MEIVGVDFSGAKADNNTWVAQGFLDDEGLTVSVCRPMRRAMLEELLTTLPGSAVAALDFPFSVPLVFARHWRPEAKNMPDLWDAAATMDLAEFITLANAFIATHREEPKRQCDAYPAFSCLHQTNPNLVPMTFYGMQMLARLWRAGCAVPPLDSSAGARTTLLESMPGAVLRAFGLPFKGYKNGARALQLRQRIFDGLGQRSPLRVKNLEEFREQCLGNHDCLDALVAAITASLWARSRTVFRLPPQVHGDSSDATPLIEGWIYVPQPWLLALS